MNSSEYCIDLVGVSRVFDGPQPVHALNNIDLKVARGKMTAIVGPSGSGKSTLLSILGLLDTPSNGSYVLNGVDVGKLPESERCRRRAKDFGFIFQSFHLLPYRSVLENIELGLMYQGVPKRGRTDLAAQAATAVGLEHRLTTLCALLSGGEQQRAAIARAVSRNPEVILCDEPTGNLDSENSQATINLLQDFSRRGQTVVLITHDSAVASVADCVVTIRDGRIV